MTWSTGRCLENYRSDGLYYNLHQVTENYVFSQSYVNPHWYWGDRNNIRLTFGSPCPLSMHLFVIYIEPLFDLLSQVLNGINLFGTNATVIAKIDDDAIFVSSNIGITNAGEILDQFFAKRQGWTNRRQRLWDWETGRIEVTGHFPGSKLFLPCPFSESIFRRPFEKRLRDWGIQHMVNYLVNLNQIYSSNPSLPWKICFPKFQVLL